MTTSVPPLPAELQARLDEIMARRPKDGRVCASHWLMLNQPPGCVEVQSCACHGLTIPERRLIRQCERGERATSDADVRGVQDDLAARSLAMRERIRAIKRKK
jgi:hypothetical protein